MNEFTVRNATLHDLDVLLRFEQGVIEAERPFDPTIRNEKVHYYDLGYLMTSDDAQVVVAEADEFHEPQWWPGGERPELLQIDATRDVGGAR